MLDGLLERQPLKLHMLGGSVFFFPSSVRPVFARDFGTRQGAESVENAAVSH